MISYKRVIWVQRGKTLKTGEKKSRLETMLRRLIESIINSSTPRIDWLTSIVVLFSLARGSIFHCYFLFVFFRSLCVTFERTETSVYCLSNWMSIQCQSIKFTFARQIPSAGNQCVLREFQCFSIWILWRTEKRG